MRLLGPSHLHSAGEEVQGSCRVVSCGCWGRLTCTPQGRRCREAVGRRRRREVSVRLSEPTDCPNRPTVPGPLRESQAPGIPTDRPRPP